MITSIRKPSLMVAATLALALSLTACGGGDGNGPVTDGDGDGIWNREREQPLGPNYDCKNAEGTLAQTVCSDPLLSRLDLSVSALYRDNLNESPVREAESSARISPSALLLGYRDEVEEEQRQWLQALNDQCKLNFDFHSEAGAHYEVIPCLIDLYAKRLVSLGGALSTGTGAGSSQTMLNVLVDVGSVELSDTTLDLGNVRIDLPQILPMPILGDSVWSTPHPACIDTLLRTGMPSILHLDACRAGTAHLPRAHSTWGGEDYESYIPWHPNWLGQKGARFGYRILDELDDGRTLLRIAEDSSGISGTHVTGSLVVVSGLQQGDTIRTERHIPDDNLSGFCGGDIHEVEVDDNAIVRLQSIISADRMMTLFDLFPDQFHRVPESDRYRLRNLTESGALDVSMSIMGISCIGRVAYDYHVNGGRRYLTGISVDVTENDRATIAYIPALACLFDLLLERYSDMPAVLSPKDLGNLMMNFAGKCSNP